MRQFTWIVLLISGAAALVGCGVPGVPKAPSLGLPEPVTDLRGIRKGDRVYLDWTVSAETTDRLALRHPGPTRICRSVTAMSECANPVGEVPAAKFSGTSSQQNPPGKVQAAYIDQLPQTLLAETPGAEIFYAASVLNANGRSAGISNVV